MQINIVTSFDVLQEIKKSKYFQVHLGFVATVERGGTRSFNPADMFSHWYNSNYQTTIYGQGKIGNIRFYTDHYIKDPVMAIYYGDSFNEFIKDFDFITLRTKPIDSYLGSIIKEVDEEYDELVKNNELKKLEEKPKGDADKLTNNPGQVTWDDIKAFMEKERRNRSI